MQCPLCKGDLATCPPPSSFTLQIDCQDCGKYELTTSARSALNDEVETAFYLGCWVFEQNQNGIFPRIDSGTLTWFRNYPRPDVRKRAEFYLAQAIRLLHGRLTERITTDHPTLRIASWSFHSEDLHALANYLVELGAIWKEANTENYQLVAKSYILHEQWSNTRAATSQVFVAMWFDPQIKDAYDYGFEIAISGAGFRPLRVDRKEHEGKIDDQIIAEIRRSSFVVADFSGHRGGVYYEAGFAHGLGRRVIFTCKQGDIEKLHFDVRQYNTILWTTPNEIVAPLQNRILALFGAGPLKPDAKPLPV
jgi:hypothetical protein